MLYSSLTQDDQLKLAADFKARYGVALKFWRGSQANILQRVVSEARGGRYELDVLETNAPQIEAPRRDACAVGLFGKQIDHQPVAVAWQRAAQRLAVAFLDYRARHRSRHFAGTEFADARPFRIERQRSECVEVRRLDHTFDPAKQLRDAVGLLLR